MSEEEKIEEEVEEKWVKTKSLAKTHMLPIELPLEQSDIDNEVGVDLIEALLNGGYQILQIPPNAFAGDFLAEKEVDEQELESIEVFEIDLGSQLQ